MWGFRTGFLVFKNAGRFSFFQIGNINKSSLNIPFRVGANGVRYGTPKDVVDVSRQR